MKVKVNLAMKRSDDHNWEWVYESDEEEPEWGADGFPSTVVPWN